MIIEFICNLFFGLLELVIGLLPTMSSPGQVPQGLWTMFSIAKQFFPIDVFSVAMGSILFWISFNFIFGGFKFVIHLGKH